MDEERNPGVEETKDVPAAGESEEEDIFDYLGEEEGEEEDETDAGSETEEEDVEETGEDEESFEDPKIEKAFAKRLAAREAKLREELKSELLEEVKKAAQPTDQPVSKETIKEYVDKLADQLAITPEAAQVLYQQQLMINQLFDHVQKTNEVFSESQDVTAMSQAKLNIEARRAKNTLLPEFNEAKLKEIRDKYKKAYNVNLPWEDAYNFLIAEEALSGKFNRKVQQDTLKKVSSRQKKSVSIKTKSSPKKPNIDDLSEEQFERLIERAKAGEFKKS